LNAICDFFGRNFEHAQPHRSILLIRMIGDSVAIDLTAQTEPNMVLMEIALKGEMGGI
jgi:hypothetical protein